MCALCKERVREYAHRERRALPPAAGAAGSLWCVERRRRADKPGSVVDDHLSCLHVAVQFLARYPSAGRAGPWRSLFALAPEGACQAAVLPRRWWSLTPPFQLFSHPHECGQREVFFFCGANPSGRPAWPLTSFLPCGARTFPHAGGFPPVARSSGPLREEVLYHETRPPVRRSRISCCHRSGATACLAAPHSGALAYHPVLKRRRASCARSDMFACRAEGRVVVSRRIRRQG